MVYFQAYCLSQQNKRLLQFATEIYPTIHFTTSMDMKDSYILGDRAILMLLSSLEERTHIRATH